MEGQIYLGSEAFHREIQERLEQTIVSDEIPVAQRNPRRAKRLDVSGIVKGVLGVTMEDLRARPRMYICERRLVADVLRRERLMPMKAIGALLGVKAWQASALARASEGGDDPRRRRLIRSMNA